VKLLIRCAALAGTLSTLMAATLAVAPSAAAAITSNDPWQCNTSREGFGWVCIRNVLIFTECDCCTGQRTVLWGIDVKTDVLIPDRRARFRIKNNGAVVEGDPFPLNGGVHTWFQFATTYNTQDFTVDLVNADSRTVLGWSPATKLRYQSSRC